MKKYIIRSEYDKLSVEEKEKEDRKPVSDDSFAILEMLFLIKEVLRTR